MIAKKTEEKVWPLCPPYSGMACIVDATELKTYETAYGQKEKFRFLIELDLKNGDKNWIISSAPMSVSTFELSALTKFCKSIGIDTADPSFELAQMAGKYLKVIVEHVTDVKSNGKTYANIMYVSRAVGEGFSTTYSPKSN